MKTQQFDLEKTLGFKIVLQEPQLVREGCPFIGEQDRDTDMWKPNTSVWYMKIRRVNMQMFLDSNYLIQGENRDKY